MKKTTFDRLIGFFSPKAAFTRKQYRFAYDILDRSRTRKKRNYSRKSGDLDETNLDSLRQIARDLSTNNPLVKGLFRKLATNIVGTSTRIQSRTEDPGWNNEAEAAFKEEMIENPCDVTGKYNFHGLLYKGYYRYAQDGDCFKVLTDEGPQMFQGEQCGTPYGSRAILEPEYYDIVNGIAVSKQTGKIIGYFLGKPNKWGYIRADDFKKYPADVVHHIVNFERFDHSRGEPMLTAAVDTIDKLFGYIDAELIAAKINACFPMVAKTYDAKGFTGSLGTLESSEGTNQQDDYNRYKVRVEPGQLLDAEPGESYEALGSARPSEAFDPFVMRMLMFVGSPLCLPLMLTTGDFSHATFMNARFAYNEARSFWVDEQEFVIKPMARKLWLWKINQLIKRKVLKARDDWHKHQIYLKRWPYIDPFREAQADKINLENVTVTRQMIAARQDGIDWAEEIWPQWDSERQTISASAGTDDNGEQNNEQ